MAGQQENPVVFTAMRGRDGSTASRILIPKHKFLEAVNIDAYRAGFARKRGGSDAVFSSTTGEAFTGILSSLIRHTAGADPTAAELWGIDDAATPVVQRLTGGTAWTSPTLKDAIASKPWDVSAASFNGKLFLAYDSAVDRLHVWDVSTVRRTGLSTPAAPTVANTGAGAYAATARHYKVAYAELSGSVIVRRSELSAAVSFTPSGTGTAAQVTKPAALSEGETHWILYGSADGGDTYEKLATTAVGTTTYDDSTNPSSYSGDAPPVSGTHTNWTSVKYLLSTGNQLLGAGSWESGGKNNRVWYSAFIGQTGEGDDESVPQTSDISNYVDLDENDGGFITGLGGPLDGRPIVFKRNQVHRLVPTGLDNPVYKPREIYKGSGLGCLRHQFIVNAEDEAGRPCVYFWSDTGPYRLGAEGPQAMVDDVQDIWDTVNLGASNVVGFSLYYPAKRQIWTWLATNGSNDPNELLMFDIRQGRPDEHGRMRDGWYRFTGDIASARCAVLFANTLGASMSRDLKPYIGKSSGSVIFKADTSTTSDAGTQFQAYADLPDRHFAGLGKKAVLGQSVILGSAGSQSLQVTVTPNYGEIAGISDSVSMAAAGSETRALRKVEGSAYGDDAYAHRIRVGDSAASTATWTIDALLVPFEEREAVTQ